MAKQEGPGAEGAAWALYPEARERFRAALSAAGFTLHDGPENGTEHWVGTLAAHWTDVATGEKKSAEHRIEVAIPEAFPFQHPSAFPLDPPGSMPDSRHAVPLPNGALCLYAASYRPDTQRGWAPWRTGEEFLERLGELLSRIHSGEWDDADRPPDLHTAFPRAKGAPAMTFVGDTWAPPAGERSGRFGVWRKSETLVLADSPVNRSAPVAETPSDEITVTVLGFRKKSREAVGAWLRLDREPVPRKTLGGVLAQIDRAAGQPEGWARAECRRLIGAESGLKRPVYLALGYPDRTVAGAESWLFLQARPEAPGKPIAWRDIHALGRVGVQASETVAVDREALVRRTGPLAKAVAGRTVIVFGVGALGSAAALLLARSGVEHLILVDGDRLRPGNVVRHVAGLLHAGELKTKGVRWEVSMHVPEVTVETFENTWHPKALRALVERADVVVDATAEEPFNLLLNEVCVRVGKPLVQVETTRRAAVGRVRIVRPRRDACLLCYSEHAKSSAYPVVPPSDEGEFFEAGCGVPTVEAPAVDVEATANQAARAVLWLLRDTLGPRNHLLVVNEALPGLEGDLAFEGQHWSVFGPVPGCACCGELGSAAGEASPEDGGA